MSEINNLFLTREYLWHNFKKIENIIYILVEVDANSGLWCPYPNSPLTWSQFVISTKKVITRKKLHNTYHFSTWNFYADCWISLGLAYTPSRPKLTKLPASRPRKRLLHWSSKIPCSTKQRLCHSKSDLLHRHSLVLTTHPSYSFCRTWSPMPWGTRDGPGLRPMPLLLRNSLCGNGIGW